MRSRRFRPAYVLLRQERLPNIQEMGSAFGGNAISRIRGGWAILAALLILAAHRGLSQTTYQAEAASLSGGATAVHCAYCSGELKVANIGGDTNGKVIFDQIKAKRAGLYRMDVLFDVKDDRSFTITVNGSVRLDEIFFATTREGVSRQTVLVPLHEGDNTITFNNAEEFGPDLDAIVIGDEPEKSGGITGNIRDANGLPLKGAEVRLSGRMEAVAPTDARGHYQFPYLPPGEYYARPRLGGSFCSPTERYCRVSDGKSSQQDFVAVAPAGKTKASVMQLGKWRIEYDLAHGTADIYCRDKIVARHVYAAARLPETVTSMDYKHHRLSHESLSDSFGAGFRFMVESTGGREDKMVQSFWLYNNCDYILMQSEISSRSELACNFISPLTTQTPVELFSNGDPRALFVPFDNDKWIRYNAAPFGGEVRSHEVSALYDNGSRAGFVLGSVEHDTWKTGVISETSSNRVNRLETFGGCTGRTTRDVLAHGNVHGTIVRSPKIFLGWFSDWRDGLERYAEANAAMEPPRSEPHTGVPFGWNSWGKIQFRLNYQKAVQVSDFVAQHLQPHHFENHGVVYIGLDSGWDSLNDAELKAFVNHCRANHQEAGIYFAPFATWRYREDAPVADTGYKYREILLYANHRRQKLDGGTALDPTHPGTKRLIELAVNRFKEAGFKYIKLDFLTDGALEADRHFDPDATTGMQAYNEGMKYLEQLAGSEIYLNQAISPLFPSQYANSRRIACDTFGDIGKIEYTLNSLTYGWWLAKVYDHNDADHVVLDDYTRGENQARVTSSVITGIFTIGDDFSEEGSSTGKARAGEFLTNPDINDVARSARLFRPVEGDTANRAANVFVSNDKDVSYLAAFNYSDANADIVVDATRAGLGGGTHDARELWSGSLTNISGSFSIKFTGPGAAIYEISRNPRAP